MVLNIRGDIYNIFYNVVFNIKWLYIGTFILKPSIKDLNVIKFFYKRHY